MGVHLLTYAGGRYVPAEDWDAFWPDLSCGEWQSLLTRVADAAGLGDAYRRRLAGDQAGRPTGDDPVVRLLWDTGVLPPGECHRLAVRLRELARPWEAEPGCWGPREKALLLADAVERAAVRRLGVRIGP